MESVQVGSGHGEHLSVGELVRKAQNPAELVQILVKVILVNERIQSKAMTAVGQLCDAGTEVRGAAHDMIDPYNTSKEAKALSAAVGSLDKQMAKHADLDWNDAQVKALGKMNDDRVLDYLNAIRQDSHIDSLLAELGL